MKNFEKYGSKPVVFPAYCVFIVTVYAAISLNRNFLLRNDLRALPEETLSSYSQDYADYDFEVSRLQPRSLMTGIMNEKLQRYEKYATGIKGQLLLAGLWPGRGYSKTYRLIAMIYVVSMTITSSGMMGFVFDNITSLRLVTMGLGPAVSCYTLLLKVIVFTIYRDDLVELHEILEAGFREDLSISELSPVLLSPLEFFYRPAWIISVSTWMLVSTWAITPLISLIIQRAHGVEVFKYRTPFLTKYPWSYAGNFAIYLIQYGNEIFTCFGMGAISASVDALFGFYVFQMTSQFRTLSYRMINLTSTDDHRYVIKVCCTRLRMLAICRDRLQTIFGPIVLCMLLTSAVIMCANIFQASKMSSDKLIMVLIYIIMKLSQALLFGWYGMFLTTESEAFQESVYCSGWSDSGDRSFFTNILIMLMYKPLVLKACHFSDMSLDMFMGITNTAVSYFFLLRTLEEK